jgi:hypothetical protein
MNRSAPGCGIRMFVFLNPVISLLQLPTAPALAMFPSC